MTQATKQQPTTMERLRGTKSFTLGEYKTAHVAHSYASQVRRMIRDNPEVGAWNVTVNADNRTVRVARPK
jgi:hypothetical protein